MPVTPVSVPKDLAAFIKGASRDDIQKAEDLLNALQNLKIQVTVGGTTQTVVGTIQISGNVAILAITL